MSVTPDWCKWQGSSAVRQMKVLCSLQRPAGGAVTGSGGEGSVQHSQWGVLLWAPASPEWNWLMQTHLPVLSPKLGLSPPPPRSDWPRECVLSKSVLSGLLASHLRAPLSVGRLTCPRHPVDMYSELTRKMSIILCQAEAALTANHWMVTSKGAKNRGHSKAPLDKRDWRTGKGITGWTVTGRTFGSRHHRTIDIPLMSSCAPI